MCLTVRYQLTCLNLSNNRIHKLDELAELVTKVPHLKNLNLSHNEVKVGSSLLSFIKRAITRQQMDTWLDLFFDHSHFNLYCLAEVWPGAGQVERPEACGAVAEQKPSLWPLQGSGVIHQVCHQAQGMRGQDFMERHSSNRLWASGCALVAFL